MVYQKTNTGQRNTYRFQMNPQQLNRREKKKDASPQAIKHRAFKYLQGVNKAEITENWCLSRKTYPN